MIGILIGRSRSMSMVKEEARSRNPTKRERAIALPFTTNNYGVVSGTGKLSTGRTPSAGIVELGMKLDGNGQGGNALL